MSEYENEYSNFPSSLITLHEFEDVDDDVAALINQINTLREAGNYSAAAAILTANEDLLEHYIIDATVFRTWEEEIYNTQVYALKKKQDIYFTEDEPTELDEDDVWVAEAGTDDYLEDINYQTGYSYGYTLGYNKGVTYADSTVTTTSASYIAGYEAGTEDANNTVTETSASYTTGYSEGYNDGYTTASGTFAVHTATISSSGTNQTISYTAEGTVLCAGLVTSQFQIAETDEDNAEAYREMTAYTTVSFSGSTIKVQVSGGNVSTLARELTATICYATLTS